MDFWGLTTLALVCFLFFQLIWNKGYKARRLPPGPIPLPILGNMLQMDSKDIFTFFDKMAKKYGPVYTVYMGLQRFVVLHGYEAIKEALIDQGDDFLNRAALPIFEDSFKGHGILSSNGEKWRQNRRFSLMTLRNFGMGKRSIEERVQEEAQCLVDEFQKTKGQFFDPTFILGCAPCNVICSILFNNRFNYDDKTFLNLMRMLNENFRLLNTPWIQLYNMYPSLIKHLPGSHRTVHKNIDDVKDFIMDQVKKHQETLDPNNPRDYIDCFLIKMQQEKLNPQSVFNYKELTATGSNLFAAGTETTSSTLRYGLLLIMKYPKIQAKVHEEIDRVLGSSRKPSMQDRVKMPYVDAVVHEIQRYIHLLPFSLPRLAAQDIHFQKYVIPKGTNVFPLLYSILYDRKAFPNPYEFDPENFLDKSGNFQKNDHFVPFSLGKRLCLGESLARMELFLFLTTILQNFTLKPMVEPKELEIIPLRSGIVNIPSIYKLALIPR
ncbi:cytochrome P450 2C23-like isoform X1 [Gracilinanus agilis]|uniref:cytochrome P450 2C23-like isoform X1 n=1 Tax=Gracilinanus agilis TaxID=191870 RepID=UPI001CFD4189|nr:cytochrome P450 2C23-like isoform X1 [Gracilinanus agilis]